MLIFLPEAHLQSEVALGWGRESRPPACGLLSRCSFGSWSFAGKRSFAVLKSFVDERSFENAALSSNLQLFEYHCLPELLLRSSETERAGDELEPETIGTVPEEEEG